MVRQIIHRRRYPRRKKRGRRAGTFIAGSKRTPTLKKKPRVFVGFQNKDWHAVFFNRYLSRNHNLNYYLEVQEKS